MTESLALPERIASNRFPSLPDEVHVHDLPRSRSSVARRINKDVEPFIRYFMPEGVSCNRNTAGKAVRHLHLAFKGKTTEEIYDVLMMQLVRAIQKYDPSYTDKVRVVAEKIEDAFQKQFTILELNGCLDFDGNRYVRLLCRRGFLRRLKEERGSYGRRMYCCTAGCPYCCTAGCTVGCDRPCQVPPSRAEQLRSRVIYRPGSDAMPANATQNRQPRP